MKQTKLDLFQVQIFLALCAGSPGDQSRNKFLVVKKNDKLFFPNQFLTSKETTKDVAEKLLLNYSGISTDWAMLLPFGVIDDVDPEKSVLTVLYGVFIPEITRIKRIDSQWMTYNDIDNSDNCLIKKLAYETIWRNI